MKQFNTVLHKVQSPKNVGMMVRSHVAFGGNKFIFVGYDQPWDFKQGSQAFSRKLEGQCEFMHFKTDTEFFKWSQKENLKNYAIEINEQAAVLSKTNFESNCNLIVGSEKHGLPKEFVEHCDQVVVIPQFGNVACLNVSVSASIAMYEFKRDQEMSLEITDSKFEIEKV